MPASTTAGLSALEGAGAESSRGVSTRPGLEWGVCGGDRPPLPGASPCSDSAWGLSSPSASPEGGAALRGARPGEQELGAACAKPSWGLGSTAYAEQPSSWLPDLRFCFLRSLSAALRAWHHPPASEWQGSAAVDMVCICSSLKRRSSAAILYEPHPQALMLASMLSR